jgi:hypothetical protein
MFDRRTVLAAGIMSAVFSVSMGADPAVASKTMDPIFTLDHQTRLCTADANGRRFVDRGRLALVFLEQAGTPYEWIADGHSPESLREMAIGLIIKEEPFDDRDDKKKAKAVHKALNRLKSSFQIFLRKDASDYKHYDVYVPVAITDAETEELRFSDFFPDQFGEPVVSILCLEGEAKAQDKNVFDKFLGKVRIRGKLTELALSRTDAKTAAPAKIALTENLEAKSRTVQADGLIGYPVNVCSEKGVCSLIPYVEYHRRKTTSDSEPSEKVETVGLGFLFDAVVETEPVFWQVSLAPQYIFDEGQSTELWKGNAFLAPSFTIGDAITLGRYNILAKGDLWVKPELRGIAEAGLVAAGGTSPVFVEDNEYFGAGAEASLQVKLPNLELIKDLTFGVSYRYMELFSLPIDRATRWTGSALYAFGKDKNFTLSFDYENGRNEQTFQDEEFYTISLGIRY